MKRPVILPISLLFGAALLLYLSFQSISLDDFDSVSFALALDNFDIVLQQPHPPGFPVYVVMGQAVRFLLGDSRAALTLVSALSGAAAVAALAWLGMELGFTVAGLLAALWLMSLPGFWLSSEIALSDAPGVALVLLAVTFLWKGGQDWRWLAAGAFVGGLCLGLRPQNVLPVVLFGLYSVWQSRKKPPYIIAIVLAAGLLGVLLWLIPTLATSGGWDAYWSLVKAHSTHVLQIDSLIGRPITGATLAARIEAFGNGLIALVGGEPWLAALTAVALAIGLARVRRRSAAIILCAAWFLMSAAQVFLLESLERPRLYLPIAPPLALLAASGWTETAPRTRVTARLAAVALAGAFALTGFPLAVTLTRVPSPPIQATRYIAARYPADNTLIVSLGSLRAAQVGLPRYPQLYLGQFDPVAWTQTMTARQPVNLVILDRDDIWPEAYEALTQSGGYVPVEDRIFSRDARVFPQHSLVRVQVLTPLRLLSPSQLALPPSGEIQVGDAVNGKYFGEGWYRGEDVGGSAARWTQQEAILRVALPSMDMTMTIEAAPYPADQTVTILVNGQPVDTLPLHGVWEPVSVSIPASALDGHPITTIALLHAVSQTPPGSGRALAAAYRVIRFEPR